MDLEGERMKMRGSQTQESRYANLKNVKIT